MDDSDLTVEMESLDGRKRKASNEQIAECIDPNRILDQYDEEEIQQMIRYYEEARFTKNGCERYYGTKLEDDLLNAYLDMFLPHAFIRHNSLDRILGDLSCRQDYIVDPKSLMRIVSTGSLVQGLSIPTYSVEHNDTVEFFGPDLDVFQMNLNTMENFDGARIPRFEVRMLDDGPPNYVLLIQNGEQTADNAWCVNKENVGKTVKNTEITHDILSENTDTFLDRLGQLEDMGISGPAINFITLDMNPLNTALNKCYVPEDHLKMDRGDVDFCIGIGFDGWPGVAEDSVQRTRPSGWPDGDLVALATSRGYGVTPVGRNHSPAKEYEWRLSFADAERILATHISDRQRTIFVLVKVLHAFFFKQPAIFKTYALKSLLFWLCERVPIEQWERSNVQMVCLFLDEMIHSLATGYLADYFIKGSNLLEGTLSCFRRILAKRVVWVKCHLFAAFRIVERRVQFNSDVDFPLNGDALTEYFGKTPHSELQSLEVREVLVEAYFEFVLSVVIDLTKLISEQTQSSKNFNVIQKWQSVASINTALVILVEAFRKFYSLHCENEEDREWVLGLVLCIESTLKNDIKDVSPAVRAKVLCMLYYMNLNGNEENLISGLNYDSLLADIAKDMQGQCSSSNIEPQRASSDLSESKQDSVQKVEPEAEEPKQGSFEQVDPSKGHSAEVTEQHSSNPCDLISILSPSEWLMNLLGHRPAKMKKFEPLIVCMKEFDNQNVRSFDNRYVLAQFWENVEKEYTKHDSQADS